MPGNDFEDTEEVLAARRKLRLALGARGIKGAPSVADALEAMIRAIINSATPIP